MASDRKAEVQNDLDAHPVLIGAYSKENRKYVPKIHPLPQVVLPDDMTIFLTHDYCEGQFDPHLFNPDKTLPSNLVDLQEWLITSEGMKAYREHIQGSMLTNGRSLADLIRVYYVVKDSHDSLRVYCSKHDETLIFYKPKSGRFSLTPAESRMTFTGLTFEARATGTEVSDVHVENNMIFKLNLNGLKLCVRLEVDAKLNDDLVEIKTFNVGRSEDRVNRFMRTNQDDCLNYPETFLRLWLRAKRSDVFKLLTCHVRYVLGNVRYLLCGFFNGQSELIHVLLIEMEKLADVINRESDWIGSRVSTKQTLRFLSRALEPIASAMADRENDPEKVYEFDWNMGRLTDHGFTKDYPLWSTKFAEKIGSA